MLINYNEIVLNLLIILSFSVVYTVILNILKYFIYNILILLKYDYFF